MKDILSEIIANKRFEVDLQKQAISIEQLQEGISEAPTSRSMKQALSSSASVLSLNSSAGLRPKDG